MFALSRLEVWIGGYVVVCRGPTGICYLEVSRGSNRICCFEVSIEVRVAFVA